MAIVIDLGRIWTSIHLLFVIFCYKFIFYPALFSPLSKFPNAHPTSSISSFWILWARFRGTSNRSVHDAHERQGPVIRLGPNELSVCSVDDGGVKAVYGGGWGKDKWYSFFDNYGFSNSNMFATLSSRPHALRKRMLSNVYSKTFLHASPAWAQVSHAVLQARLIPILELVSGKDEPINVYPLWMAAAMDVVSGYLFGISHSTNFLEDTSHRDWFMKLYHTRHAYTFYGQEFPQTVRWVLAIVGIRLVPKWVDEANKELEDWCTEMCTAAEQDLLSQDQTHLDGVKSGAQGPVVYAQLRHSMIQARQEGSKHRSATTKDTSQKQTKELLQHERLGIASEMLDHLAAGHETTGITLTYLTWELSQRPALQSRLRAELHSLPSSSPSPRELDSLPLLHALVLETLRLHPAIPGAQPRISPRGAKLGPARLPIPAGVKVSAQAYSLHRNAEVFPCPEEFIVERWLPPPLSPTADSSNEASGQPAFERDEMYNLKKGAMNRQLWAFGSGGRMCVGSNLAVLELKSIVWAVYSRFSTTVVEGGDEGIEQGDGYTEGPRNGGRLALRFEAVES